MKKRALMVTALVLVSVLILVAALVPREPRYEGETLSYWMAHWYRGTYGSQALVDASALAAVREIGTNGLPYYIAWMGKPMRRSISTDYASRALRAFEVLGPTAKPAIPALIGMLGKGGNLPAVALAYIGRDSIPALTNFLATNAFSNVPRRNPRIPPWMAERNVIEAFEYMGTNAESAIPCLIRCLQDGKHRSQTDVSAALAAVGRNRPDWVVPVLVEALANTNGFSRACAADALSTFQGQATSAVPFLHLVCQDQDAYVRTRAAAALRLIAPYEATALWPLIQNLTNRTVLVREQALWALEPLGTNGLDALPVLVGASLHDPVPEVRTIAVRCIVGIGKCSDEVLAGLVENLSHTNEFVRSEAIGAIGGFAAHSQPAFDALLKASRSQDRTVREQARNSVTIAGNQNPSLLVTSFDSPDAEVRSRAFQVLYFDVGVERETAVSALLKALRDGDFLVREVATNTLRKMDPVVARTAGVMNEK
jgi:HEAT repeat protein